MGGSRLVAILSAVVIAAALPGPTFDVRLTATALVMSGTNETLSIGPSTPGYISDYVSTVDRDFITPSGWCVGGTAGCDVVAVYTPEKMGPLTGLTDLTFDESVAAGIADLDGCLRGRGCGRSGSGMRGLRRM